MNELNIQLENSLFSIPSIIQNILPHYNLKNPTVSIIKFKDTDKQRAVYRIDVNNKSYCLKKVYYSVEELLYVYSAIEWLHRNNLNVPQLIPTTSGGRYVKFNEMYFILTPWINATKCDFDNKDHIISAAIELGKLHKCSTNFMPVIGSSYKESLNDFYLSTLKHFEQLLQISSFAFLYKDKFSKEYLVTFDKNLRLAEASLRLAGKINSDKLSISLCHGDYVNKNILFSPNNELYIIDFDKCKKDYCAHDIAYFLRRLLKRDNTKWNLDLALSFIKYYNSIHILSESDLKYILSYLAFPQKYWKVSKNYYKDIQKDTKNIDNRLYLSTLNKSTKNLNHQITFINEITSLMERNNWNLNLL